MTANLAVGTMVRRDEMYHGHVWSKVGIVVEIGKGRNAGRVRVLWSMRFGTCDDGTPYEHAYRKRTWVAVNTIKITTSA
jgi:hypothetical protein